jgi:hypothetical protein
VWASGGYTDCVWTEEKPTEYTFSGVGEWFLYGWARDSAGNISDRASDSVIILNNPASITNLKISGGIVNPGGR